MNYLCLTLRSGEKVIFEGLDIEIEFVPEKNRLRISVPPEIFVYRDSLNEKDIARMRKIHRERECMRGKDAAK